MPLIHHGLQLSVHRRICFHDLRSYEWRHVYALFDLSRIDFPWDYTILARCLLNVLGRDVGNYVQAMASREGCCWLNEEMRHGSPDHCGRWSRSTDALRLLLC